MVLMTKQGSKRKMKVLRLEIIHPDFRTNYTKRWRRFPSLFNDEDEHSLFIRTEPDEYLNGEHYQNRPLFNTNIDIAEFLETAVWNYEKIIIQHKFKKR